MSQFGRLYRKLSCSFLMALLIVFTPSIALSEEGVSRQEAIAIVKKKVGGKILKVKQKDDVYRVKVLTKGGTVRLIRVDADSGKILSRKK